MDMSDMPDFAEPQGLMAVADIASIETEGLILGSLMLNNVGWDVVGDMLTEADFFRYQNGLIFAAISALVNANKPAELFSVMDELRRAGKEDAAGGLPYLHSLTLHQVSQTSMRSYARTVREFALRRKLMAASSAIHKLATDRSGTFDETLEKATAEVTGLFDTAGTDEWEDGETGMTKLLARIQAQADGTAEPDFTPTGLTELDARLDGGVRGGELIVVGARPSMGKSALGLSIAAHIAIHQKKPIGVFSMEMPKSQMFNRLMSLVSHIHLSRVKRGERLKDYDWPAITSAVDRIRHADISINDRQNLNINQVRASARALRRRRGPLGLLVVDYLGLMAGTNPKISRAYQLEEVTKGLKSLAKELGVPILLLAQLNRGVEERIDQMPVLSDLRDSGAIEQDADIVVFVHRPYKAKPDLGDEWKHYAKVSVPKLRDGEPGYLDLMYVGENTRFADWPADTPVPTSQVRTKSSSL